MYKIQIIQAFWLCFAYIKAWLYVFKKISVKKSYIYEGLDWAPRDLEVWRMKMNQLQGVHKPSKKCWTSNWNCKKVEKEYVPSASGRLLSFKNVMQFLKTAWQNWLSIYGEIK